MYVGIDLGTSGVKVALMGMDGSLIDTATAGLAVSRPNPLWNEQDPETWWMAANKAMLILKRKHDMSKVLAVGLSGQMHGATLLDKKGRVLRPCILWCDGRCALQCRELEKAVPHSRETTGNLIMPGFTAGKLLWVRQEEPDIFEQVDKVLLPKDYLRFRMTGDFASEMSDSSGTMWMDTSKRDWNDDLLHACGLSRHHMPKLYEGSEVTGHLKPIVAKAWGMREVPVVGGGGDNAAGAVGAGLYKPGQAMLSLGTSGVYFIVSDGFRHNTKEAVHSFCHALPNSWHLMSVILSAASCLDWAANLTGCKNVAEFVANAEKAQGFDVTPVWFLPYLAGDRTPHNNADAKGVFFGLTAQHGRSEVARAVLEGVSFALAQGMDAVHRCNVRPTNITLIGGGSRSAFWRQMLADVTGQPLDFCSGADVGPALGAARLAQMAMEQRPIEELLPHLPLVKTHHPDMGQHKIYLRRRKIFAELYKRLEPLMVSKL
ncbi:putative xylulokinase [Trypanosoma rangeli]|uniref:glycerol kinase n=1 Tax=Trypanosoma rangeli TaxID=5698 RepID=A0A3R7RS99_TRYRA|nr:putative xylulokinase [Trypanosoma rangeli]RNF11871.1 putative xylulokinase [Trypanosoma rangeli]|eukprot:RNF11871.1 putative xylulokinase [Trypanosoma rangeli]